MQYLSDERELKAAPIHSDLVLSIDSSHLSLVSEKHSSLGRIQTGWGIEHSTLCTAKAARRPVLLTNTVLAIFRCSILIVHFTAILVEYVEDLTTMKMNKYFCFLIL